MLQQIAAAPWRSTERQQLFDTMHERLGALRSEREEDLAKAHERLDVALRRSAESAIRMRRTWAFPLYPQELIEALRARIGNGR